MARKHFAIAKTKKMRDLGILPPKSSIPKNFRTEAHEFKVEIVDYKKVKTIDEQLTSKDCDSLFFDFIDFLLQRNVFNVAGQVLEYIQDKGSARYLMAKAQICVLQQNYRSATEALDKLLAANPGDQKAWILRGHAFYSMDNLFDSEESYINALRIKPAPTDRLLAERLGIVYAQRKSWKDAKTVFMKVCKERMSTTAWVFLGLSLVRLGELAAAEDAIAQANVLDNLHPGIWGLNAVLCLKYGRQRLEQACFALDRALALGLKQPAMLDELGDMLEQQGLHDEAVRVYSLVQQVLKDEIQALGSGYSPDDVADSEDAPVVEKKRARGLIL